MRAEARQTVHEDEEESAFISMTDMTVGFLFIVMILLAFFASQFRQNTLKNVPMVEENLYNREKELRNKIQQELLRSQRELIKLHDKNFEQELLITSIKNENKILTKNLSQKIEENIKLINEKNDLEIKIENLNKELRELKASMRDPLETYLKQVSDARRKLLEQLRNSLNADFPDIPNLTEKLTEQSDALRFEGDGLFIKGKDIFVSQQKEDIIKQLAIRLNEILPCYTFTATSRSELKCENPNIAIIEAVQVEGHTDSDGSYNRNIELSATRATTTFKLIIETVPGLREFKNSKDQAVMSFAGYGPDRPIATNNTEKEKAKNRRIDLRFIMVTPSSIAEMETIRTKFRDLQVK